jgi:long-chain fatty acid transport protein
MTLKKIAALLSVAGVAVPAFATNGMNLEGYGAVATAMGGASMAYDNGAGAMMNNPATLGLMGQGSALGVALGFLGPDVKSSVPAYGMNADSSANAFYMPAIGYLMKTGKFTFGAGVYSQGGMGTEYDANSFLAMGTGDKVRSEVGVGRLIFPLAYNVNDSLSIGGSVDWVWATMDIKMAASSGDFMAMANPSTMTSGMGTAMQNLMLGGANTFRIDFSDNNDFSGKAVGTGFAGKLGLTYKVNSALTFGAVYHSKTDLGDMETDSGGASFSAYNSGTAMGAPVTGKITIHNFQWPETYGLGMAYQVNDKLMIAADYKRLNWSKVMKDFKMTYTTDNLGTGVTESADFKISQNWADQDVFMIGGSYRLTDAVTLRAGGNFAKNPIPDDRVHPLFPAIIKSHYTFGVGYMTTKTSGVDFSLVYAPEVSVTGTGTTGAPGSGVGQNQGINIKHSQLNWNIQYGMHF